MYQCSTAKLLTYHTHNSMVPVLLLIPHVHKNTIVREFCTYLCTFPSILLLSIQTPSLSPSLYLLGRKMLEEVNIV